MIPSVVLDSNATLDWLVFRDPEAQALGRAIQTGSLRWLASAAVQREFDQVLGRPALAAWAPDRASLGQTWAAHATLAPAEPPPGPLRCTDPDDQVFIDLALHTRADWLVTRDRALLALAPRARALGLSILTPSVWSSNTSM